MGYKTGKKVSIATNTKSYDPIYYITIFGPDTTIETSVRFDKIFDITGYINSAAFLEFLKPELVKLDKKTQ